MGSRRDTGHPTSSLLFWPRSEQSHLQGDKECAPGDREAWARQGAATQGQGVAPVLSCTPQQGGCRGWGALCLLPPHHSWEPVCCEAAKIDANDFGPQLQAATRGSKNTVKGGKHGPGQALPQITSRTR